MSAARVVAITGASGFLGTSLATVLERDGVLVRRVSVRAGVPDGAFHGVDAVVHLAGEPIGQRWSARVRAELKRSRIDGTNAVAAAVIAASPRPAVLVSASAVGIYGSRGDELLDESSALGDDYLAEVGEAWERASQQAASAGVRVVNPRTGIVLHPRGGALAKMLTPFQLGVGGRLGNGTQWMSWISRHDWIRAVRHLIDASQLRGAVNLVAPEPVTNATFTATLGRILRRPTIAPVPAIALKVLFGEMAAATVLASQRVRAQKLEDDGFTFAHTTLSAALRYELELE